eukprot:m.93166 g.93166  ORF g.93166 m.93166 type:complete len:258 (+) comp9986_c0_seq2:57-830(+)
MELPEPYKIYPGTVERLTGFGCFVRILGFAKDGLVHISQLANARVENVEDVVAVGDKLFVKVLSLGDDPENPKISLSIKTVNQSTGADLDPTNLVAAQDEKGKKGDRSSFSRPKIELGAVYNITCTKCGAKGHLAKMCMAGGSKYDLVDEPEDDGPPEKSAIEREFERHARRLEKKAKKAAKAREKEEASRRFNMDAYMAAGEAAISGDKHKKSKHKHKHSKKEKKDKDKSKKKRKSRGSDSSDDSDDGGRGKQSRH